MLYTLHVPADVRAALGWRVAIESGRKAREDRQRFTAAVAAEVERRLAGP